LMDLAITKTCELNTTSKSLKPADKGLHSAKMRVMF